jgi:hypothetical protein
MQTCERPDRVAHRTLVYEAILHAKDPKSVVLDIEHATSMGIDRIRQLCLESLYAQVGAPTKPLQNKEARLRATAMIEALEMEELERKHEAALRGGPTDRVAFMMRYGDVGHQIRDRAEEILARAGLESPRPQQRVLQDAERNGKIDQVIDQMYHIPDVDDDHLWFIQQRPDNINGTPMLRILPVQTYEPGTHS